MPGRILLFFLLILFLDPPVAYSQTIQGQVIDVNGNMPIGDVSIENIYTNMTFTSSTDGKFLFTAAKGQLLEFKKNGYKSVKVRIPSGDIPPYFKIIMQQGADIQTPQYVQGSPRKYDYASDSIRFHDIYKHELDFARMSGLDAINHPFSALSKKNREIWAFQDDYEHTQQEKYVDDTFNPDLVANLTGLADDDLRQYMRRYRPSYQQLRTMNEYTFYNYIKRTAVQFRNQHQSSRNTN